MRQLIQTREQFDRLKSALRIAPVITVDIETNGLNLWQDHYVVGIAFYVPEYGAAYLPVMHGHGKLEDGKPGTRLEEKRQKTYEVYCDHVLPDVVNENVPDYWLIELIDDIAWRDKTVIMHNAMFDLTGLHRLGFPYPKHVIDTLIVAHAVYSDWRGTEFVMPDGRKTNGSKALKWLAEFFQIPGATAGNESYYDAIERMNTRLEKLYPKAIKLNSKSHLWMLPPCDVLDYATSDVELTYALYERLHEIVEQWELQDVVEILCAQIETVFRMHRTGYRLDTTAAQEMITAGAVEQNDLTRQIQDMSGGVIQNPNSPKQIVAYLHGIGIPTKSADKQVIEEYKDSVPVLALIAQLRHITKMCSTYAAKWLETTNAQGDEILHVGFNLAGTKTGRWSSSSGDTGNFQNIPRDDTGTYAPKNLLKPLRDSWVLVEADYASLESRIGAWVAETLLSGDANMTLTNMIVNGADMHSYTMQQARIDQLLLGNREVTENNVLEYFHDHNIEYAGDDPVGYYLKKVARQYAKVVNFACQYGGTGAAIARSLGIKRAVADKIYQGWVSAYPAIPNAIQFFESLALTPREINGRTALYLKYPLDEMRFLRRYDLYDNRRTKNGGYYSPRMKEARNAFNSVIQGTSGFITTLSAHKIAQRFDETVLDLHGSVHDSIIFSVAPENLDAVLREVKTIMETWDVTPGLIAEFEVCEPGAAWGTKKPYEVL